MDKLICNRPCATFQQLSHIFEDVVGGTAGAVFYLYKE